MLDSQARTALVTGGTDGIGKEIARGLLEHGFNVIIVGRDPGKGKAALAELHTVAGADRVQLTLTDLSVMTNVVQLAAFVREQFDHLDALVHSAGIILTKRVITSENMEMTWATDYLSRYVLTKNLLPLLEHATQARVVFVAASGSPGTINFADLLAEQRVGGMRGLGQAQFANDVLTLELARRFAGSKINFYALHPGSVDTNIRREFPGWLNGVLGFVFRNQVLTAKQGAEAPLRLVLEPEFVALRSGLFKQKQAIVPTAAADSETGRHLWGVSEQLAQRALGTLEIDEP